MVLPTASEITSLYLYGQGGKPSDLLDPAVVRAADATESIDVNASEIMSDGPGRFANPVLFDIVQLFFSQTQLIAPGVYEEGDMRTLLGTNQAFIKVQQWAYSDNQDDYAERVYIWNTTAYELDDQVRFVVNADGSRSRTH